MVDMSGYMKPQVREATRQSVLAIAFAAPSFYLDKISVMIQIFYSHWRPMAGLNYGAPLSGF